MMDTNMGRSHNERANERTRDENDRWVANWNEWRTEIDDAYEAAFELLEGESPELGIRILIELEEGEPGREER